jgi:hypothetical protein
MKKTALILVAALIAALPLSASAGYYYDPHPTETPDGVLSPQAMQQAPSIRAKIIAQYGGAAKPVYTAPASSADIAAAEAAQRAHQDEEAAAPLRTQSLQDAMAERAAAAEHRLDGSKQQIRYCVARINQARDALKREDEIERESGVQNLRLRYDAGSQIAYCNGQIDVAFREYRQLGGTAPTRAALIKQLIAEAQ